MKKGLKDEILKMSAMKQKFTQVKSIQRTKTECALDVMNQKSLITRMLLHGGRMVRTFDDVL